MKKETSFERLKKALLDIKDYYPDGIIYGKLEYYFEGRKYILDLLLKQKIFELIPQNQVDKFPIKEEEKKERWYRPTKRGIDLAISMINLEHSKETRKFTIAIIILTFLTFWIGLNTLLFQIFH